TSNRRRSRTRPRGPAKSSLPRTPTMPTMQTFASTWRSLSRASPRRSTFQHLLRRNRLAHSGTDETGSGLFQQGLDQRFDARHLGGIVSDFHLAHDAVL